MNKKEKEIHKLIYREHYMLVKELVVCRDNHHEIDLNQLILKLSMINGWIFDLIKDKK